MNIFDEFIGIIKHIEREKIRYALVGGVAMAFYTEPRFTQDIDLLIGKVEKLSEQYNIPAEIMLCNGCNKMGLEKWAESKASEVRKVYFNKPWTLT